MPIVRISREILDWTLKAFPLGCSCNLLPPPACTVQCMTLSWRATVSFNASAIKHGVNHNYRRMALTQPGHLCSCLGRCGVHGRRASSAGSRMGRQRRGRRGWRVPRCARGRWWKSQRPGASAAAATASSDARQAGDAAAAAAEAVQRLAESGAMDLRDADDIDLAHCAPDDHSSATSRCALMNV